MYFEKFLLSFFTLIFVYCATYCESGVNDIYENNILELSSSGLESLFFTNGENSKPSLHNASAGIDDMEECKCENGRCESTCAEWKNGACHRMTQVCVCDPEFGKKDKETCIYCDCGKGFNCTINRYSRDDIRQCICPEGLYDYFHECAPFCNERRPCQNGGTCQDGKCKCMSGTHGPFCERIFWCAYECRARLTIDCVYNQEAKTYGCLCKNRSLVYDYREQICKPCPCGEGTCREERHELRCDCKVGYKEFKAQCIKCDCGPDQDCELHWRTGEKICKCRQEFIFRDGTCVPCECGHKEATCSLDNVNRKICHCPEGYEENLGLCEEMKENCTCHPTAKCKKTDSGFSCVCEDGYTGQDHDLPRPGEPCIDIDECSYEYGGMCPKWTHQKCVNFPGSFMCQCQTGYQPVGGADESGKITCKEYTVSWLPTGITIGVIIAFIAILIGFSRFLRKRESSRNTPGFELQTSR